MSDNKFKNLTVGGSDFPKLDGSDTTSSNGIINVKDSSNNTIISIGHHGDSYSIKTDKNIEVKQIKITEQNDPPLIVNNSKLINNLNADKVDGLDVSVDNTKTQSSIVARNNIGQIDVSGVKIEGDIIATKESGNITIKNVKNANLENITTKKITINDIGSGAIVIDAPDGVINAKKVKISEIELSSNPVIDITPATGKNSLYVPKLSAQYIGSENYYVNDDDEDKGNTIWSSTKTKAFILENLYAEDFKVYLQGIVGDAGSEGVLKTNDSSSSMIDVSDSNVNIENILFVFIYKNNETEKVQLYGRDLGTPVDIYLSNNQLTYSDLKNLTFYKVKGFIDGEIAKLYTEELENKFKAQNDPDYDEFVKYNIGELVWEDGRWTRKITNKWRYKEYKENQGWVETSSANRITGQLLAAKIKDTFEKNGGVVPFNVDKIDGMETRLDPNVNTGAPYIPVADGKSNNLGTAQNPNLDADSVDGYEPKTTATANSIVARDNSGNINVKNITSANINATGYIKATGDIDAGGNATIDGNLTINGSSISAQNANVKVKQIESNSIIPNSDGSYDLGSSSKRWNKIYAKSDISTSGSLSVNNVTASGNISATGSISTESNISANGNISGSNITANGNLTIENGYLELKNSGSRKFRVTTSGSVETGSGITPLSSNAYNLGSSDKAWKELYLYNNIHFSKAKIETTTNSTNNALKISIDGNEPTVEISHDGSNGQLKVLGDLSVTGKINIGSFNIIEKNELKIGDNIITLNSDVTGTPTENAGFEINRGSLPNVKLYWDETDDVWKLTDNSGDSNPHKILRDSDVKNSPVNGGTDPISTGWAYNLQNNVNSQISSVNSSLNNHINSTGKGSHLPTGGSNNQILRLVNNTPTWSNETTYSASNGITLDGTTFKHTNSVTPYNHQETSTQNLSFGSTFQVRTLSYDSYGHITKSSIDQYKLPSLPSELFYLRDGNNTSQTINRNNYVRINTNGPITAKWNGGSGTSSSPYILEISHNTKSTGQTSTYTGNVSWSGNEVHINVTEPAFDSYGHLTHNNLRRFTIDLNNFTGHHNLNTLGGNVSVGDPGEYEAWKIDVNRNYFRIKHINGSNENERFHVTSEGIVRGYQFVTFSDERLKENVQELDNKYKELLLSLKPVTYNFKNSQPEKTHIGLIAQDVKAKLKELELENMAIVNKDEDGYYSVDYTELLVPLISIVQDLKKENEILKQELNEIKNLINKE